MQQTESHRIFGGEQQVWQHASAALGCNMKFAVYLPDQARQHPLPVLYWLSGLTCTEQNFITKAACQQHAAEHGLIIVAPDTSPRGADVADDPAYDLGQGAGFYLNATQQPWAAHYRMADYISRELPELIDRHFPTNGRQSISGHSMGGHGALTLALNHPDRYRSVSAFAPIVAPSQVPWGQKAFGHYLGNDPAAWQAYDTIALLDSGRALPPTRIDQGLADEFYADQLNTPLLEAALARNGQNADIRYHEGYDHSYYFIQSFIGEHIAFHAQHLKA